MMPTPLMAFGWMFGVITLFGLLVGLLNLIYTESIFIPGPSGESAEGLKGFLSATLAAAITGLVFGSAAAYKAWLFGSEVRMRNSPAGIATVNPESNEGD